MRPIKIQQTKTSKCSEMLEMKSGSVKDMERYGKSSIASSGQMETLKADPTTPNKFFSKTAE